jgi:pyruvate dehydrogenase E2 component (dihydrolipoamide acetyltransferase)
MIHEVFMPALSSTMTEGKIVSWVKSPGDKVEKGETVVVVESDKADMDVESFYEGYLAIITVPAGESAPVGAAIALVAETEAEIETAKQQATPSSPEPAVATAQKETAPAPEPVEAAPAAAQDTPSRRNGRIIVSPRARKLAKELKVDLGTLKGSGPHGRIVAEDVEGAAGKGSTPVPAVATTAAPAKDTNCCATGDSRTQTSTSSYSSGSRHCASGRSRTVEYAAKCGGTEYGCQPPGAHLPRWLHHHYRRAG